MGGGGRRGEEEEEGELPLLSNKVNANKMPVPKNVSENVPSPSLSSPKNVSEL